MWEKIQIILDRKDMTLRQLSYSAGFRNPSTLYMLKRGKVKDPGFHTMIRIANALGVSLDELKPDEGKD